MIRTLCTSVIQGDNAQFNLSLAGADSATFTIEPEGTINNEATVTVRVKDKSQLDFETRKELSFQVYFCPFFMYYY